MKNIIVIFLLLSTVLIISCNKDENPIIEPSPVHPLVGNWNLHEYGTFVMDDSLANESTQDYTIEFKDDGTAFKTGLNTVTTNYWVQNDDKDAIFIIEEYQYLNGDIYTNVNRMTIEGNEPNRQVWKNITNSILLPDSTNLVRTIIWTLERQ